MLDLDRPFVLVRDHDVNLVAFENRVHACRHMDPVKRSRFDVVNGRTRTGTAI